MDKDTVSFISAMIFIIVLIVVGINLVMYSISVWNAREYNHCVKEYQVTHEPLEEGAFMYCYTRTY